ncbi:MAG: molybdenum cofactor guanylyltransferase [Polyangiaceae bacterium]
MTIAIGIFVGGRGRRMGGADKGLLPLPEGGTVLARLVGQCRTALPHSPIHLIGDARAYADFNLPALTDEPPGIGPLGGLIALLRHSGTHSSAIVLACDMPYVSAALLARLANEAPDAAALAPRRDGHWEPLCARYGTSLLTLAEDAVAAQRLSLQHLFEHLGEKAQPLTLSPEEERQLFDWDTPEDIGA